MYYSNIDFTVVYVDPTIASPGDGATPATALNQMPSTSASIADNTCYLIRRTPETQSVSLPSGTCSAANLMIWGMPQSDDPDRVLVPIAARDAWGADTSEYANVKANTASSSLALANIKNFSLHRVYLFRENTAASQPIFSFTNSTNIGAIGIDRCKFGAKGIDLEQGSFTETVTTSYCRAFVHVKSARVFSLKNTIINHVTNSGGYGSGSVNSIYLETANFVTVNNVEVFVTTTQYNMGGPMGSVGIPLQMSNSGSGMYAAFENIKFNVLLNNAYEYIPQLLVGSGYNHIVLRNIRVETTRQLGNTPAKLSITSPLVTISNAAEFRVENFTANLPECWYIESSGRVLSFSGTNNMGPGGNGIPGYEKIVKNITIQMAETNGLDSTGNGLYYSQLKNIQYLTYYAALELNFSYSSTECESVLANNITVNHPRGVAFYGRGMQMNNCRFKGAVHCSALIADIESISTFYPGYALHVASSATVRVRLLTLGKENAAACGGDVNDPAVHSKYSDYGFLYVDASNAPLRDNTTTTTTTSNIYGLICSNETDAGHFVHRTENCVCDTWNVNRTNGAPACLKIWNNTVNSTTDLTLGRVPFKGIQIVPEAIGVKTLKVYVAAKNLTDLADLYRRLIVQATVPNESGFDTYFSSTEGGWSPDASVWNNDSDLTGYVLLMPLQIHSVEPIDVKIHFNWFSQTGFVYIDPEFKLE